MGNFQLSQLVVSGADVVQGGRLAAQRLKHAISQIRRAVELLLQHRGHPDSILGALRLRTRKVPIDLLVLLPRDTQS